VKRLCLSPTLLILASNISLKNDQLLKNVLLPVILMTRLSNLRSKLFAYKLTSSISDKFEDFDRIDALLTQARLGHETILSQTSGEKVDQRRSASRGQVIYRQ
jgi:hypothetical protein